MTRESGRRLRWLGGCRRPGDDYDSAGQAEERNGGFYSF